ncbi:BQ5605_C003g02532 [Microbotryum silenes-dioicae]|uniref:BQ5605_C003g02508 protein n=1 Tax=Microbotryum silenes-dioicae TaxID=796604 RepID=A0A2X0M1R0_9BASI|nr:BQ5605_C003g02508 [Microbotryum silenes-dioicae]SGY41608.1 BQ5605_C003g02532 [Microbotryum silenes-dioicae]
MRTPVFQLFCSTAIIAIVHAAWASASPFRGDDGLVVSPKGELIAVIDARGCPGALQSPDS